jgi:peptidoglycan/LPS O-acetylase OafA/YrhL
VRGRLVPPNLDFSPPMAEERSYQLDSMRALGLAGVIFQHTMNPKNALLADIPALALTMFFVLSGFLITGLLLDARTRAEARSISRAGVLGRFYIRRFLRIFPVYYGVLLVAVLMGEPETRGYLNYLLTYTTNFLLAKVGHNLPPITPFWSLAVEEHFYFFWPFIALFASRRVMWTSATLMVIVSVVSRGVASFNGAGYNLTTMPTYASLDGIAIGCMLAIAYRDMTVEAREPWIRRAVLFGGTVVVIRMLMMIDGGYNDWVNTLHAFPFALVTVWLIDRGARGVLPKFLNSRVLGMLGMTTYTGYVVHRYVMHFLGYDGERGLHVFFPVLLVSYGIAIFSWFCVESPINSLKRFWPYVPRPAAPAASPAGIPATVLATLPGSLVIAQAAAEATQRV